jgi:8-oxo-dGTP pyrophosphatase MutT (NUDIX family)
MYSTIQVTAKKPIRRNSNSYLADMGIKPRIINAPMPKDDNVNFSNVRPQDNSVCHSRIIYNSNNFNKLQHNLQQQQQHNLQQQQQHNLQQHNLQHNLNSSQLSNIMGLCNIQKYCKVHCGHCKLGETHHCKNCDSNDSDHRSSDCPLLKKNNNKRNMQLLSTPNIKLAPPPNLILTQNTLSLNEVRATRPPFTVNMSPNIKPEINPSKKIVGTLTIFVMDINNHGRWSVLVCRRGVEDNNYGKIFSQGGTADRGETPEQASVREAREEAGVFVNEEDIVFHSSNESKYKQYFNFRVYYTDFPEVYGPEPHCENESLDVQDILHEKTIILPNGKNTRQAWVPIDILKQNSGKHAIYF